MKISTENQPYNNPELNQPRDCIWIEPENISEYRMLLKLSKSISGNDEVKAGFTGIDKQTFLIQMPTKA